MFDNEICYSMQSRYKDTYCRKVSSMFDDGMIRSRLGSGKKLDEQGHHNLFSLDELQREVAELMLDVHKVVPFVPEILNTCLANVEVTDKVYLFWLLYIFAGEYNTDSIECEIGVMGRERYFFNFPVTMIEYYMRCHPENECYKETVSGINNELAKLFREFKDNFVPFFGEIPSGKDYEPSRVYMKYWCSRNDRLYCLKSGENTQFFAKVIEQLFPIRTNEMEEYRRSLLAKLVKP